MRVFSTFFNLLVIFIQIQIVLCGKGKTRKRRLEIDSRISDVMFEMEISRISKYVAKTSQNHPRLMSERKSTQKKPTESRYGAWSNVNNYEGRIV